MSPMRIKRPAIAESVWNLKYRLRGADGAFVDRNLGDTFHRVASAAAAKEKGGKRQRARAAQQFEDAISDFGFLPAGRILAGAGSRRDVTLFNCFVMDQAADDLGGIFERVRDGARTMQSGGGIGQDFSTLRPRGSLVKSIGADASGPVSFMDVWDSMCGTIMSAGARRGAMMGTLRADHPDIEAFIAAKSDPEKLRNFNLSVLVSDKLVKAVREDADWDLVFDGKVYQTMRARDLWHKLMQATYDYAEPGVIFIDRINARNNLNYCEHIHATNPCGEQPLPPNGACLLGSINLAALVRNPFGETADINVARLESRVAVAVRFLDNLIDVSKYPLKAQRGEARAKRRMGLGITGLADALILCGLRYDSQDGLRQARAWMAAIQTAAYQASVELAAERGAFPLFETKPFLKGANIRALPKSLRKDIKRHGIRNGCLTSIAPTGTISLFAGNVSSGIEPVFSFIHQRSLLGRDGISREETVEDYAHALYRHMRLEDQGEDGCATSPSNAELPEAFISSEALSPKAHLEMQAALQPYVDSSISKTINCPEDVPFDAFQDIYLKAYDLGLKGCTTYRPNPITGSVLRAPPSAAAGGEMVHLTDPDGTGERHDVARDITRPDGDVVYMSQPLERDATLQGYTYKLKWPTSDHAIYVTINDIEHDGRRRPFEIFINSRNLEHYAWTVALTRMISAVFRRGGDVSFVADELQAIFDPQGGSWMDGRYVPSLLAAIGDIVEGHMQRIGFLATTDGDGQGAEPGSGPDAEPISVVQGIEQAGRGELTEAAAVETPRALVSQSGGPAHRAVIRNLCPRCSSRNTMRQEGCLVCLQCGFSRCG